MKCHYEVLDVPPDADEAEIKTAYRKLALKWHPDKNLDNIDYAKQQFQLVQQAYEVLSDKQERAWYDNHREQILRGADSEFEDNSLNVFQYFGSCFSGYEDNENGFYTVYRTVFEKITKEDIEFMDGKKEFYEIPSFGNSQTDYEKVAEFYIFWSNYMTKKSYVWLDPYNIKDIRDRRYFKLIEKENKKVRQQAKKERNEEIRNLVAFVRKRDKRVKAQKKVREEKQLLEKKKREQLRQQKKLQRQQELNDCSEQPEWAKFDNFKAELEELEKNLAQEFGDNTDSETEIEEDINNLYCDACNKMFKTPKSFENHELSKKHKENVEILRATLLEEEHSQVDEDDQEIDDCSIDKDLQIEDLNGKTMFDKSDIDSDLNEDMKINEYETNVQETKQKKKKKTKNVIALHETEDLRHIHVERELVTDSDNDFHSKKKQKKGKKKSKSEKSNSVKVCLYVGEEQDQSESIEIVKSKKHKKDRKNKNDIQTSNDIDISHNCLKCKSIFPSKNKLFDHLKKTGHGIYLDPSLKYKTK